jgi:hypothetical protein
MWTAFQEFVYQAEETQKENDESAENQDDR